MVTGQAMDLFSHLYPVTINGDYLEIRTLPDKKQLFTSSVGEAVQSLGRLRGGQNVHFGLCPRREPSGKTSATSRLPAMFVDFDFKDHALGGRGIGSWVSLLLENQEKASLQGRKRQGTCKGNAEGFL